MSHMTGLEPQTQPKYVSVKIIIGTHDCWEQCRNLNFFTFRNGSVVLTVSLGGPRSRQDNFLVLTLCCVATGEGEWTRVEAGRDGREGYLRMSGQRANGLSPSPLTTLGRKPCHIWLQGDWWSQP